MIFIFHVALDDTDSPDGMCTTYLAYKLIEKLKENYKIIGLPRLIRLNPFARHKTRGNGAVHFKVEVSNEDDKETIKNIAISFLNKYSVIDCDNTNPAIVFYEGEITKEMIDYSLKAIHEIITIKEAERLANRIGADYYKLKKGRGIIGSLAAIACPLNDKTYELLNYRVKENYGKKRLIDYSSVHEMDSETYPETFENLDGDYIAIEPHTPCPVLYGIRGESPDILKKAYKIVKVYEKTEGYCIFETNQHTDMHLLKINKIADMEKFSSYTVKGNIKNYPHDIEGGHVFFTLKDDSGEIEAAAYEPTKDFRKIVKELIPGDEVELYGGIGEQGTFNIEKFELLKLKEDFILENPMCSCGKRMKSAGKNKGFKCPNCRKILRSNEKVRKTIPRKLKEQFYESPVSARRHLSKPLIRMNR